MVVNIAEWYLPKRAYFSISIQQQGDVTEDRQHQHAGLTFLPLRDRFSHESGQAAIASYHIAFPERQIDVVALCPIPDQRVESLRQRVGARIVIKMEFSITALNAPGLMEPA